MLLIRTSLELKRCLYLHYLRKLKLLNRTSLELNRRTASWQNSHVRTFNRTSLELKHIAAGAAKIEIPYTFNRTSLELKLPIGYKITDAQNF